MYIGQQDKEGYNMSYTYEDNIISDLHKNAYGFRPSQRFFDDWAEYTPTEKQEVWDSLVSTMEYNQKEEARIEAANLVAFRKHVAATMKFCDCNWKKAVEFLADAEGEDIDNDQAFDYFLWCQGIGFEDRANIRNLYKKVDVV
jgi:hypothetical protein